MPKTDTALRIGSWVPDHTCPACISCGAGFGMLNRKHHCRICGMIFCGLCTRYVSIPAAMLPYLATESYTSDNSRRGVACESCNVLLDGAISVLPIIRAMLLCEGLTVIVWARIGELNADYAVAVGWLQAIWHRTVSLAHWRGEMLTAPQVTLLRANERFLRAHARCFVQGVKAGLTADFVSTIGCKAMMCGVGCTGSILSISDCIDILLASCKHSVRDVAYRALREADTLSLRCFLSTLTFMATLDLNIVHNVLAPTSTRDPAIAHLSYWRSFASGHAGDRVRKQLLHSVTEQLARDITRSEAWVFDVIKASSRELVLSPEWTDNPPCVPGLPDYRVVKTLIKDVTCDSQNIKVPVVLETCTGSRSFKYICISLSKNLLKSTVVLDTLQYIDCELRQMAAMRIPLYTPHVVTLGGTCGLYVIDPTAEPCSDGALAMLEQLMQIAPDKSMHVIKTELVSNIAYLCTMHMVMGISTRVQSMYLTQGGQLYQHYRGDVLQRLSPRYMIPMHMVDVLDGPKSRYIDELKRTSSTISDTCRARAASIFYIFYALVTARIIDVQHLRKFMNEHLSVAHNCEQIDREMSNSVDMGTSGLMRLLRWKFSC